MKSIAFNNTFLLDFVISCKLFTNEKKSHFATKALIPFPPFKTGFSVQYTNLIFVSVLLIHNAHFKSKNWYVNVIFIILDTQITFLIL